MLTGDKKPSRILSDAADILVKHGVTGGTCWESSDGRYCTLGAIARAAYPKTVPDSELDIIAYRRYGNPNYLKAVGIAATVLIEESYYIPDDRDENYDAIGIVYDYNDELEPKERLDKVVALLRKASERAAAVEEAAAA